VGEDQAGQDQAADQAGQDQAADQAGQDQAVPVIVRPEIAPSGPTGKLTLSKARIKTVSIE